MTNLETRVGSSPLNDERGTLLRRAEPLDLSPERVEIERDIAAAGERDAAFYCGKYQCITAIVAEFEKPQRPRRRIDVPVPMQAEDGVIVCFLDSVAASVERSGRHHAR